MKLPLLEPRTARTTGLLYLGMALAGALGFLIIRPMLYDPASPTTTLENLVQNEGLARSGIATELVLVALQALVALWFYRFFRRTDAFAGACLAAFGLVNAVAVLASAACLVTALDVALTPPSNGDAAGAAQLLYALSGSFWDVGSLFFGLWLVPMGILALRSGMPRSLGRLVVAGGIGYVASVFITQLAPSAAMVGDVLAYVATVGELWMIGWLLWYGTRAGRSDAVLDDGLAGMPAGRRAG